MEEEGDRSTVLQTQRSYLGIETFLSYLFWLLKSLHSSLQHYTWGLQRNCIFLKKVKKDGEIKQGNLSLSLLLVQCIQLMGMHNFLEVDPIKYKLLTTHLWFYWRVTASKTPIIMGLKIRLQMFGSTESHIFPLQWRCLLPFFQDPGIQNWHNNIFSSRASLMGAGANNLSEPLP